MAKRLNNSSTSLSLVDKAGMYHIEPHVTQQIQPPLVTLGSYLETHEHPRSSHPETEVGPSFKISHTYATHPLSEQPSMQLDPQLLVQHHSKPQDLLVVAPPHPEQLELVAALGSEPPL